jgi:guanylate kinase
MLERFPDSLSLSVSATSRVARENEQNGVHYHFLSREEFQKRIEAGEFFEHEEIHGNLYGTLRSAVEDAIASGSDLLLDIDIQGAETFFDSYSDNTVIIFLVPPSKEEMERRIRGRSAISDEEVSRRFQTAEMEYQHFFRLAASKGERRAIRYLVVNDDFEVACDEIAGILRAERCKVKRMDKESLERICSL